MTTLEVLFLVWTIFNLPCGAIAITVACFSNAEYIDDFLLYPLLISSLRKKLSIVGTAITATLFSIFFSPAIIVYFMFLAIFALSSLIVKGFIYTFRRKV